MKKVKKEKRRYGQWAGDPAGNAERPADCIYEVYPDRSMGGYGPDGLYCIQHAKKMRAK